MIEDKLKTISIIFTKDAEVELIKGIDEGNISYKKIKKGEIWKDVTLWKGTFTIIPDKCIDEENSLLYEIECHSFIIGDFEYAYVPIGTFEIHGKDRKWEK